MKIISKRQAMALYRQHPAPGCFASVPANINGLAVSAIMLAGKFRTYVAFWPCLLNVVRTAMVPM